MAADGKHTSGRMSILTVSARKRNRKEAWGNYYKTIISIDHQHARWIDLKGA